MRSRPSKSWPQPNWSIPHEKDPIAALITVCAAPAFAEPACNPGTGPKPVWDSMKAFESEVGPVIAFKINSGGC